MWKQEEIIFRDIKIIKYIGYLKLFVVFEINLVVIIFWEILLKYNFYFLENIFKFKVQNRVQDFYIREELEVMKLNVGDS